MPSTRGFPINFFFRKRITLKNRNTLKAFLAGVFRREKVVVQSLDLIFCADRELLKINQEYLGHDDFTDIITFNLSEKGPVSGEIYISVDRVRENALDLGVTVYEELHRVIFHGVLHLCGYEDRTKHQKKTMRGMENKLLKGYSTKN